MNRKLSYLIVSGVFWLLLALAGWLVVAVHIDKPWVTAVAIVMSLLIIWVQVRDIRRAIKVLR